MKRRRVIIAVILSLLAALVVAHCARFEEVDACLEQGGHWDYEAEVCEGATD